MHIVTHTRVIALAMIVCSVSVGHWRSVKSCPPQTSIWAQSDSSTAKHITGELYGCPAFSLSCFSAAWRSGCLADLQDGLPEQRFHQVHCDLCGFVSLIQDGIHFNHIH